jgi:hypothetical protein
VAKCSDEKIGPAQGDIVTISDRNLALKIAVGLNEELRYILLQALCTCYAPVIAKLLSKHTRLL